MPTQSRRSKKPWFSIQLKPVGSACNINCRYCYVEPFRSKKMQTMSPEVLEKAIASCMASSPSPTFSWHGGEPTLAGIPFFETAVELMRRYCKPGVKARNMIQTNATRVTPAFAWFFKKNDFEVSVSLDGPEDTHGVNRVKRGRGGTTSNTFDMVMRGVENLRRAGIEPSLICTNTRDTLKDAEQAFLFFVESGFRQIKYSPVYDSPTDPLSVSDEEWFEYLQHVFREWFKLGDTDIQVRDLDEVIAWISKKPLSLCSSNRTCLHWVSVNPDGNLYPCEYLRTESSYGNILDMDFTDIPQTATYRGFRRDFGEKPEKCSNCEFFSLCGNGCPVMRVQDGQISASGVYVYCNQRKMLYTQVKQAFEAELGHSL